MAELLEVPILKGGIHNGFEVQNLQAAARDTMEAMPYLLEAQYRGAYRGDANQRFNDEIPPSFLNLQHDVIGEESTTPITPERLKELTLGVQMEVDTRLFNGEEWVIGNFRNVKPELAKLLSGAYPGRSVEILPNFQNPDTGQIYPVVLRSVAFLDPQTDPAVPQTPGYSVKLSQDEGVQVVRCDVPATNNQHEEEVLEMPKEIEGTTKLSQDAQREQDLQAELDALKAGMAEKDSVIQKLQAEKKEDSLTQSEVKKLAAEVAKLREEKQEAEVEAFCVKLASDMGLTKSAVDIIRPVVAAKEGVVKMSADSEPIPVGKAYKESLVDLLKLAKDKDALFIPESPGGLVPGKQQTEEEVKQSPEEQRISAIQKFWKDDDGKEKMPYHKAREAAINDPEYAELFDPTNDEEGN
jgi:hypothetical protein